MGRAEMKLADQSRFAECASRPPLKRQAPNLSPRSPPERASGGSGWNVGARLCGEAAAVNTEFDAGDVGSLVRGEEQYCIRHLFDAAGTAQRHPLRNAQQDLGIIR